MKCSVKKVILRADIRLVIPKAEELGEAASSHRPPAHLRRKPGRRLLGRGKQAKKKKKYSAKTKALLNLLKTGKRGKWFLQLLQTKMSNEAQVLAASVV